MFANALFSPRRYQSQRQLMEARGGDPGPIYWTEATRDLMVRIVVHGVPNRFSHWTFGEAYLKMLQSTGRIYEFVVWGSTMEAYIDDTLSEGESHLIAAHVMGHTDFMRHNFRFDSRYRLEAEDWIRHAQWVDTHIEKATTAMQEFAARYKDREGMLHERDGDWVMYEVYPYRELLDDYTALDLMVTVANYSLPPWERESPPRLPLWAKRPPVVASPPPEIKKDPALVKMQRPTWGHVDTLDILQAFARPDYVADLAGIFQQEEDYFHVLKSTKIMNEGWASYWHQELAMAEGAEYDVWEQAFMRSLVEDPRPTNPYWLGSSLFRALAEAGEDPRAAMQQYEDGSFLYHALTPERFQQLELVPIEVEADEDAQLKPVWNFYHAGEKPEDAIDQFIQRQMVMKRGLGSPMLRWLSPKEIQVEGIWGLDLFPNVKPSVAPAWFVSLATLLGRTLTVRLPHSIAFTHTKE